jgi:hypothetical protein
MKVMWWHKKKMTRQDVIDLLREIVGEMPETIPQLVKQIKELVGPLDQMPKLKRELEELKLKKTIEMRDIEHLVKIKEEKLNIEHQKKELELKNRYKDMEMKLQTAYHEKVLAQLDKAHTEMKDVHTEIMKRLPNVNVELDVQRTK